MKQLTKHIIQCITESYKVNTANIVKVEGISSPLIYRDICIAIKKIPMLEVIPKLSLLKYLDFKKQNEPSWEKALADLSQGDNAVTRGEALFSDDRSYVDWNGSITKWRNAAPARSNNATRLLLLMGTEAIPDKGGLGDFDTVSPEKLVERLNGNYSEWFCDVLVANGLKTDGKESINALYKAIFSKTNIDLMTLSNFIDSLDNTSFHGYDELISYICNTLDVYWKCPSIYDRKAIPSKVELMNPASKATEILSASFDFIGGGNHVMTESKEKQLQKRIAAYKENHEIMENDPFPVGHPVFNDFKAFERALTQYLNGENTEELRPLFMNMDFAIIDEIWKIKLKKADPKKTRLKINGEPLPVYITMISSIFNDHYSEMGDLPHDVKFKVVDVRLSNCASDYSTPSGADESVRNAYLNVCAYVGGILGFIQEATFSDNTGDSIAFSYDADIDPFDYANYNKVSAKIKATGKNGEACSIDFDVCADNQRYEFRWVFSPYASWKNAFNYTNHIFADGNLQYDVPSYCACNNIGAYLSCESEEEFFAKTDRMDIENLGNEHCNLVHTAFKEDTTVLDLFDALMQKFKEWATGVSEHGLFTSLAMLRYVVKGYCDLQEYLSKNYSTMTSAQKSLLFLLLNIFCISANQKALYSGAETAVIIPAYHPTMLEKIDAQNVFLRNGLFEIAESIRADHSLDREYIENLFRLATITQGPDIVYSEVDNHYLPCISSWRYAAVYSDMVTAEDLVANSNYESVLVTNDDDENNAWLRKTPESNIISRNIIDFIRTFPARIDGLNVTFISPKSMQQIVAALYTVSSVFENEGLSGTIFAEIICTDNRKNSASYLKSWMDSYFDKDHDIKIHTSLKYITSQGAELISDFESKLQNVDLCFIYGILQDVGVMFERYTQEPDPNGSKFPMTFIPESSSATGISGSRRINISHRQFRSSEVNTQLAHKIGNPQSVDGKYQALSTLRLNESEDQLIDAAHRTCRWVVCVDEAIDRKILEKDGRSVIGFSTGEGRYGELNVTVSASDTILLDIKKMLQRRLMRQFPAWDVQQLTDASEFCVDVCKNMDGSKILKALNPYSFEIHSFLAYVLTLQIFAMREKRSDFLTRNLISLDSYLHWFSGGYADLFYGNKNRPDFMLLEIPKSADNLSEDSSSLDINITIVECKMGIQSDSYITHAQEQLLCGIKTLADAWTNNTTSVTARYWFGQLYRAVVFSTLNMSDNDPTYSIVKEKVYNITNGKFSIHWDAKILAYWVDSDSDQLVSHNLDSKSLRQIAGIDHITYMEAGQRYIQKMLLPAAERETARIEYSIACAVENGSEGETPDGEETYPILSININPLIEKVALKTELISARDQKQKILAGEMAQGAVCAEGLAKTEPIVRASEAEPNVVEPFSVQTNNSVSENAEQQIEAALHVDSVKATGASTKDISRARFLIGEDVRTGEKYYWEFGNKELNNRHLLINGNSGCGKTYCIQTLLMESSRQGISSVVFDYTGGFASSKLDPIFKEAMGDKIVQRVVKQKKIPVNPFVKHDIQIDVDMFVPEENADVADKLAEIFKSVYSLGDQQRSAIYTAVLNGLMIHGDNMSFPAMVEELGNLDNNVAKTVISKIQTFTDFNPFTTDESFRWEDIRDSDGTVYIFQLAGYGREIQVLLTEILLWDIWSFCVKSGDETKPFILVMDEAQNLSHGEKSPSAKILTEGRKFGISGWYATQFMKPQLSDDEIQRLQQAGQKLYFCPPDEGVMTVAKNIDINAQEARDWAEKLKALKKGECVTCGNMVCAGHWTKYEPRIIKITSLQNRLNEL